MGVRWGAKLEIVSLFASGLSRWFGSTSLVYVLVHVPVHDDCFESQLLRPMKSALYFSWSNSIRAFVYVNVYRFAVNVYGLLPSN